MDPRKKFRFGESVGRDQLGEVYRAEDSNGNELAIKIFDSWTVENEDSREAYARALAILRSLKPRRTPPILGYRIRPENAWLATQWIESKTLSAKLDEVGELNEQETATIACGILDALAELHGSEFAHGGITPNKILLTRDVSAGGVVITDPFQHNLYSVSNPIETLQSEEERFIGLPEYFSPEQAQGSRPDLRSDIYVIGLIIYKMLTGRTPFESGNPSIILKRQIHEQPLPPRLVKPGIEISSELEAIIQQALAKNPEERFDSPRAMRAAIAAVREDFDADSEIAATPLGPYPIDAEVPDADAGSEADAEQAEPEAAEESEEDTVSEPDAPMATAECAAVEEGQRRHMTETPVALGAVEDDEVSDQADDEDPIQFLDDDEDSPFEDLDQPQADHSYDGTDDETLEAIEDFATLAAEFDYGFDDEQTNSWFAAGDDAEEMADRHGDELPPSPKESERRHNRAFFLLVPLALIATIAAVLVMSSNNEGEGTEGESADQVAEAEQEKSAEGTATAETDAGAEDAQEGQALAAAAAGTDAAGADAEGEVAEGDAESEPETDEQAQGEEQVAAAAAAEEEEETEEQEQAEERQAREEEAQERAEAREEGEAEPAQEEEEAEQQVAAAEEQDSGDSETDSGSSTGSDESAQAATAQGTSGADDGTTDSGSGASEGSGEGTQVAEAEAADPEAETEAQRQAEEEARQQAEEERRQREEAERQAQRSREIAEEARSALSSGNLDQARRLFNEALTIDSSNTSAHAGLGDTYFRMNEYRRAIPHHQAAGQYRALGMDYFRLNEYPKALQAFERAASQGDPNAERYVNIVRQRMTGNE